MPFPLFSLKARMDSQSEAVAIQAIRNAKGNSLCVDCGALSKFLLNAQQGNCGVFWTFSLGTVRCAFHMPPIQMGYEFEDPSLLLHVYIILQ